MLISWREGIFFARCTIQEAQVLRSWGWSYDTAMKRWITDSVEMAAKWPDALAPSAAAAIEVDRKRRQRVVELSFAVDAPGFDVPLSSYCVDMGWAYRGFQRANVKYGVRRPRILIADAPGLGKTISAIGRTNYHACERNLVIPMAAHRVNWRREIEAWAVGETDVNVISPENLRFDPGYPWTVISYNYAKEFYPELVREEFDHIIVDEAHYLRGQDTNRTVHILGGGRGRDFKPALGGARWSFLTGTPIDHRPADMWTLARFCDPKGLGAREDHYQLRYCGGHVNEFAKISAAKGKGNLEELQFRARAAFMTRREKGDVIKDLPPKQRQVILVPQSRLKGKLQKEQSTVASALDAFVGLQEALYEDIADKAHAFTSYVSEHANLTELDGSFEDVLEHLGDFRVAQIAEVIATARRELAEAKIPIVLEHVISQIESGAKVLVFGYHRSVVKAIKAGLADVGIADFTVSTMRRQDQVDKFQTDPRCRCGVGNIMAAGVGYTMTAADLIVFPELSWSPTDMTQAEDRAHRIGLEHSILIHYLIVEGSLDSYMVQRIIAKQIMAERALSKDRLTIG